MDENKVDGSLQETQSAGVEAQAEQTAEAVAAKTEPTAGATQPATEPKNDTETEHAAAGKEPQEAKPATGAEAKAADAGAANPDDPAAAMATVKETLSAATKLLLTTQAEAQAAMLGVKSEKIKHVVKMAELAGIDPMASDAAEKIGQQVKAVLADVPELLNAGGTGSAGAFARTTETASERMAAEFRRGLNS